MNFNIICSMKLNDGDTALVEEYDVDNEIEIDKIVKDYTDRATDRSYVDSFNIVVKIKR